MTSLLNQKYSWMPLTSQYLLNVE